MRSGEAANEIRAEIERAKAEGYETFGLRADKPGLKPGDSLPNSHTWYQDDPHSWDPDGEYTYNGDNGLWMGGEATGVSTVGISRNATSKEIQSALGTLESYVLSRGEEGAAYLIGSRDAAYDSGEDDGEFLLHGGEVLMEIGSESAAQTGGENTVFADGGDTSTDPKSKPKLQARDNMADRRELLLGAAEEDRADTALSAYRKKFLAMEAAQRRLERQREALAAMERETAEERSFDSLALAQDDRGGALAQENREGAEQRAGGGTEGRSATPVTRSLVRNDREGAEQRAAGRPRRLAAA